MKSQKLNVDVPRAITEFESAAKEFELKEKLYRIIFRGKGLEFDKYRDYSPDEDATNIDWRASMRANKLIAKQYIEERDLNIVFAIDVSENMLLGSSSKLKCEYSAELVAALAHLMINANDKVGFVLFSDKVNQFIPPKGGNNQFYFLMDVLADPSTYGGSSSIKAMLDFLLDYLSESIDAVVIISDFIKAREGHTEGFYLASHKFETMAIMVKDLLDKTFPDIDREIVLEDPVTKEQILVNPRKVRGIYEKNAHEQEKIAKNLFKKSNIDVLELMTDKPFSFPLAQFLSERISLRRSFI